jgi:hypothetical protein
MCTISTSFSSTWWDSDYNFRSQVQISTGTNSPYNGYQNYTAQIEIDSTNSSLFNTSGDDIRIIYWNGSSNLELDREVLDPNNIATRIRFKLQQNESSSSTNNNSYYLYYSNPTATSPLSNLSNVYLWYDDASSDRESQYVQGRLDNTAHGSRWGDTVSWNAGGYYDFDTGDNYVDSLRPIGLIERDVYFEYDEYQTNAYPNDMTSGPVTRWTGTGTGNSEDSAGHFYYYEMGESLIQASTYGSHDTITDGARGNTIISYGLLGFFPTNVWTRLGIASWGAGSTNIKAYYNNESGGWGGSRFSGTHSSGAENTNPGQFGPWLQQDAGRVDNFLARRYTEPEPSLSDFNQTPYASKISINLNGDIVEGSTTFVEINTTKYLNATITCSNSYLDTCGQITAVAQFNNSPFSGISSPGFGTPFYTIDANPQTCDLSGGNSCSVSFNLNATGVPGNNYLVQISLSSNESTISNENSSLGEIKITQDSIVSFNRTNLNLGSTIKNSGDLTQVIGVVSYIGNNNNIIVECGFGDCSTFSQNFTNGINLTSGDSIPIQFTCSDTNSGYFSAIYNITSDEHESKSTINVSCNVEKIFGPIISTLIQPLENTTKTLGQNQSYLFKSNIACVGECGNITTYAIIGKSKTGLSSLDPADSGWQIKKDYPNLNSGTYWIQTQAMSSPELIYVDMDFDGGGWMLIGRGREGWAWSDSGRGTTTQIALTPSGTSAFSPVYYSSSMIDDLINGTDISSLTDGVRIRRTTNTSGTSWQEGIWMFDTLTNWDWNFDIGITLSDYIISGFNYGSGSTNDISPSNNLLRTFTTALGSHNNQEGFSFGASVCDGSNSATNYLWEYIAECNSIPFTQVYVRPHYEDLSKGQIISPTSLGINTTNSNPTSSIFLEDEQKELTWQIQAIGNINSSYNISTISFSNKSIINSSSSGYANISIVSTIAPIITLESPENNEKLLIMDSTNFIWYVEDDDANLSCSLFINSNINQTMSCASNLNTSIYLNLANGDYSWYVQVNDSDNNSINSDVYNFTIINQNSILIKKEITYVSTNLYSINITKENLNNNSVSSQIIDFVPDIFTYGSFTPIYSLVFNTTFPYFGNNFIWNTTLFPLTLENKVYSITSPSSNYSLLDVFMISSN